ncbi:hypothetical protein IKE67_04935 [bacterium]|nr:hypothetical protein [bacterium]
MRKLFILSVLIFTVVNQSFAVDFKSLEPAEKSDKIDVKEPKALLNDKDYKLKGRVEYDEEGTLFLDTDDVEKLNLKVYVPKKYPKKSVLSEQDIFTKAEEQRKLNVKPVDEYLISPISSSLEYKYGKFSYGTTFGTDIDTAQLEYRTKLFVRYDNKIFGLMGAVGKDAYTSSGTQMSSLYLAPEIKLSKGLTLVDTFKVNPDYEKYQNDIFLRYSPKIKNSRDIFYIEAGVGQTSYHNSGEQLYQFSVSTKFNF